LGVRLVRGAWRILVGIKDALVLAAMLLFFGLLFAALSAKPNPAAIRDGALVLRLNGAIVEQPAEVSPFQAMSGGEQGREFRLRDLLRAAEAARTDDRVKAVVLDLDGFLGGYPASVNELGAALKRVRDEAHKPVLAFATAYTDSGYRLAANASEVWVDPMGCALFTGPGGSQPYLKGLLDKLGVTAHVYRVGKYKSAVEPFILTQASPEAKEENQALANVFLANWRETVTRARPKAQVDPFLTQPQAVMQAAGGDMAAANLRYGIVDKLGDRIAFGRRVAAIDGVGADARQPAGAFRQIRFDDFVDAHPLPTGGDAIGVVTVAGNIIDGKAGPGTAGGETISRFILNGLAKKDLKALVIRVDSGGGSVLASEQIRQALLEAKRRKLPVVASMGGVAASGGYWVSTPADAIFAEPGTITGSIGIFGIIPTFENAIAKIGVSADGVATTPLSGQPDVLRGTNAAVDQVLQAGIEHGYRQFLTRVSQARHLPLARVDQIGQGRVWDGGTARQLGLVDRFGGLDDAIAEAARRAKLDPAKVHVEYLEKKPGFAAQIARQLAREKDDAADAADVFALVAADRRALAARALGEARRLASGGSIQAACLGCAAYGPATAAAQDMSLLRLLLARLGW
jgi:protease IV